MSSRLHCLCRAVSYKAPEKLVLLEVARQRYRHMRSSRQAATGKERSFWSKFCFLIGFWKKNLSRIDENLSGEAWQDSGNHALFREGQSNSIRRKIPSHHSPCLANTPPDTSNTVIWQEHFSKPLHLFLMARTSFYQKYSPRTMFVFKIQLCLAGCTVFIGWSNIKGPIAWLSNSDLSPREAAQGPEGRRRQKVCSH